MSQLSHLFYVLSILPKPKSEYIEQSAFKEFIETSLNIACLHVPTVIQDHSLRKAYNQFWKSNVWERYIPKAEKIYAKQYDDYFERNSTFMLSTITIRNKLKGLYEYSTQETLE